MRTSTRNDITRTETLSDADLEQVAGGFFCATPPVDRSARVPPGHPCPGRRRAAGAGPDPIPPRFPLPKWRPSPVTDAEAMLPDLRWDAE